MTLKKELKGSTRSTHSSEEETRPLCAIEGCCHANSQVGYSSHTRGSQTQGAPREKHTESGLVLFKSLKWSSDHSGHNLQVSEPSKKNGKIAWFKGRKIYQKKKKMSIKQSMTSIFSLI